MRSLVEGMSAFRTGYDDPFDHGIGISAHIASGDAQSCDALFRQPLIAGRVLRRPVAHLVRDSVYLDRQQCVRTEEVQDVAARRMLPAEFETAGPLSKADPEDGFRRR